MAASSLVFNPELALAVGVLLWGCVPGRAGGLKWLGGVGRWRAIALAALVPMLARLALLGVHPVPEPRLHDEFSFLLGASTLLEGRLGNPTPLGWVNFESMHILCQPSYASAFPLAQAGVLALGTLLGNAWIGVWLSVGLLCGALCWMLQGFMPARWALYGSLLAGLRLGVSSYWMNSYWGGAVAATGGALVLGAWPRLEGRPGWRPAVVMGVGFALLANSRVVEGAALGVVMVTVLAGWLWRMGPAERVRALRRGVAPLVTMLGLTVAGLGFYFYRVTGSALRPPYLVYRSTASMAPHFLWQSPRPEPLFNNRQLRHFYAGLEMRVYTEERRAWLSGLVRKGAAYWRFYAGPLLSLPLLGLGWAWRRRRCRRWMVMGAAFSLVLAGQVWHNPHYAAPAYGLLLLGLMECARVLSLWRWRGWWPGRRMVQALGWACAAMLGVQTVAGPAPASPDPQAGWRWASSGGERRAAIGRQLRQAGGRHLVMVRYGPWHDPGDEWVYNEADIERAQVIWARELDRFSNARLIEHYGGRQVWLVEPDEKEVKAVAYASAEPQPMAFVALGAPGIEALRDPERAKSRLRSATEQKEMNCEQWNWHFMQLTGVAGPRADTGCYPPGRREQPVGLDHYFEWLRQQR